MEKSNSFLNKNKRWFTKIRGFTAVFRCENLYSVQC